jgi:HD superfamily phosphohydrolase
MIIDESFYGRFELDEPLLLDLLQSDPVQRLKGVYMGGVTSLLGVGTTSTRYEHSVGAMLLVRLLGASQEEQAAALLHDVSHTALSHVIDFVFDTPSRQAFHDDVKEQYVSGTSIPRICAQHRADWQAILDEEEWPLLEQPSPRLCADRIDYSLRDAVSLKLIPASEVPAIVAGIQVQEGRIVFAGRQLARRFAELYLTCDSECWSAPKSVVLYELTARALRRAVAIGILDKSRLWLSDRELWDELGSSSDAELHDRLEAVLTASKSISANLDGTRVINSKVRTIDPEIRTANGPVPLSNLDPQWAQKLTAYRQSRSGSS